LRGPDARAVDDEAVAAIVLDNVVPQIGFGVIDADARVVGIFDDVGVQAAQASVQSSDSSIPAHDGESLNGDAAGIVHLNDRLSPVRRIQQSRARHGDQRQPVKGIDLDIFMARAAHFNNIRFDWIDELQKIADLAGRPGSVAVHIEGGSVGDQRRQ